MTNFRDEHRRAGDAFVNDPGFEALQPRLTQTNGGHDFFEGAVARALAEAVDGALDLRGPVAHAGQGQRRGHAQIVMAVHRHGASSMPATLSMRYLMRAPKSSGSE